MGEKSLSWKKSFVEREQRASSHLPTHCVGYGNNLRLHVNYPRRGECDKQLLTQFELGMENYDLERGFCLCSLFWMVHCYQPNTKQSQYGQG